MPRVVLQRVAHRLDHVRHRVQPDDVGGAVGRTFRAADGGAGERVDDVDGQSRLRGVRDRREHRENADPVRDEKVKILKALREIPVDLITNPKVGLIGAVEMAARLL